MVSSPLFREELQEVGSDGDDKDSRHEHQECYNEVAPFLMGMGGLGLLEVNEEGQSGPSRLKADKGP